MEANQTQSHKQATFQDVWPQAYQNTQVGSLDNNLGEKSKKNSDDNCQQTLKKKQPQRKLNGIEIKNKTQERQVLSRVNGKNGRQKKLNHIFISPDQKSVQQNQNYQEGNGQIGLSQKLKCWNGQGYLNECGSNRFGGQIYNNQKVLNKQRPFFNQKSKYKNLKITSSKIGQISSEKLHQILINQNLQMFLQGSDILYPIPDYVMQLNDHTKTSTQISGTLRPRTLPNGFCYLLQMLNLSYLFPQLFKFDKETIAQIVQIIQAPSDSMQNELNHLLEKIFKNFMNLLSTFIIEDLNNDWLSAITDKRTQNILSLAKFCQENDLIEFVFKYCWPLILSELANISVDNSKEAKTKFQESIKYMKNCILNKNFNFPENFESRFQLISFLIDSYSTTNSFREFFNKKIEINRNVNKRRSELEDEKKIIQQNIKKFQNRKSKKSKKIAKKDKKKPKHQQQESEELSEKQDKINRTQAIEKLQKQLEEIQQEIQKQNRQDSLSCCHYLGKDKNSFLYWVNFLQMQYVSYFPNKLFIESNQNWSFFQIDQINQFIESLNRKAINESRLYQKVQEYYQSLINKHIAKMEIETEENNGQQNSGNHSKKTCASLQNSLIIKSQLPNSSKNSHENHELLAGLVAFKIDPESLFRMIELGEKKMTEYLKDRNSRWGSEQNKQILFSTLKDSGPHWLQQVKKQISLFNQKICVVEIQYKVFVQQSVEQVDSKIKKIQTKIWGINEKFKHNWYDFINSSSCFSELFFAVSVLYSLIKKYTSKHRKLRKEYEEIKQKTVWNSTNGIKEWKQVWNETCEVCGSSGEVLCCDFCPKVYHLECVNMSTIPEEQFKCKSCTEQITTRHQLKSIANEGKKQGKRQR